MSARWNQPFGYDFQSIKPGDIIDFRNVASVYTVAEVKVRRGRHGMGGMDMGTPDITVVIFADGTEVEYDPWVDASKVYRAFRKVGHADTTPSVQRRCHAAYLTIAERKEIR